MARALMDRGFTLVRPLAGGLSAWVGAGFPVEPVELAPTSTLPVVSEG